MAKKKANTGSKRPRNTCCSFCRKEYQDVGPLVEGPGEVYICGECIDLCKSIFEQEKRRRVRLAATAPILPSTEEVQRRLSAFIPEQEKSARFLAVTVRRHFESLSLIPTGETIQGRCNAILLVGPTQSSKLLVTRVLADIFDVPFAGGDATTLTTDTPACGDTDTLLYKLLIASDFDIEAAQRGIIYVDGVDRRDFHASLGRALDGTANYGLPSGDQAHGFRVDVSNILFVCGGSFEGLDAVIAMRGRHPQQPLLAEDLVAWGMPLALARRFHALLSLDPLDDNTLLCIASVVSLEALEGAADRRSSGRG